MNRFIRNVAAVFPFALASVFLLCTDFKNNNPTDSAYMGNYALKLTWQQTSDTLEVFKHYRILCALGRDTFSSYKVDTASPLSIDSIKWGPKDTLVVHATRPVKDTTLFVSGVRPNNETVVDSVPPVVATNPYIIKPNANAVVVGDTIFASIGRFDGQPVLQSLFAIWYDNGSKRPFQSASIPDTIMNASKGLHLIDARLQDSRGNGFTLAMDTVKAGGFRQALDSAVLLTVKLGSPLIVAITQTDSDASPFRLYVTSSNGRRDSSGAAFRPFKVIDTIQLVTTIPDTATLIDTVFTVDSSGLVSRKIAIKALVLFVSPKVAFVNDSMIVQFQDSTAITLAPGSTGAKFIWVLDTTASKPDTTILPTFMLFLNDSTQVHSLKVTAVDQYGIAGTPATLYVSARTFYYKLNALTFPTQPKVNTWTMWTVSAGDTALARKNNARFHWAFTPRNYDSLQALGPDSSTLKLLWSSVTSATISVNVIDSQNNTSAVYSQNIAVRRYGPSIKITNPPPLSGNTTAPVKITVSAIDTNVDGTLTNTTISKILWQRTGKNPAIDSSSDSSWQIPSTNIPDTFTVYARARDVDGNLSQPDSIQVFVKAYLPYILPRMNDVSWFIDTAVQFTAYGNVSNPAASITKYLWSFSGSGAWTDSSSASTISHTFTSAGKIMAMVKCRDNTNLESAVDTFYVTISTGAPQAIKMSPDTVWIDDDTLYTITAQANPTAALKQWVVQWDAAGPWDTVTTDTLRHVYASAGLKQLTYFVIDKNGTVSNSVNKSMTVLLGAPSIISVGIDSALSKIFINDSLHFTVHGFDPNGQIDSMKVAWMGDTNFNAVNKTIQGNASVFANAFATSGTKTVRFRVYDNDGLSSDTIIAITVRQGRPVISSVTTDVPLTGIFRDKPVNFTVNGQDTNGNIVSLKVAWNGDTAFSPAIAASANAGVFNNTFATSGTKTVRFRVYDNDGLSADTTISFFVHQGKPVVTSITPDSILFINDARKFFISTYDTNGTVDSIKIDSGNGAFGLFVKTTGNLDTLKRTFGRLEAGTRTIRVIAKDNDGLLSDTARDTVVVRLGTPVIDRIAVDTLNNNLFVVDNRKYSVSAHDTNGFVKKIYFSWNSAVTGGAISDSIIILRNTASIDTFISHIYDTTMSGPRTIRVWAIDDDTIASSNKDTVVTVRLGRPVLWGDIADTLWTVVNNGPNYYYVHANALDTNGNIQKYYWNDGAGWIDSTTADSIQYQFRQSDINHFLTMNVSVRDTDGLMAKNSFQIYADSAPPAPVTTVAKVGGQIQIGWLGKDTKDGNGTLFEILLKNGSAPALMDTLIGFRSGTTLSPGLDGYDFSYTFTPSGGAGTYYYQVVAKDARGSVSYNTANFFIFP